MSRIVDLTLPLTPGQRGVAMEPKFTIARGGWNAVTWQLYSHTGTHMDAQVHFASGPETIDQLTPERGFFGALPLKLSGGDGCPVRAFAIDGAFEWKP
jgi:kynurenine formamidase